MTFVVRGMWLCNWQTSHWFFHNSVWSVCGMLHRDKVALGYTTGVLCRTCTKWVVKNNA